MVYNIKNKEGNINKILDDAKNLILRSDYYSGDIETIEFIKDKLTEEQFEGYLMGNMIKYVSRYNKKGKNYKDLLKAFTYNTWLLVEERENKNEKVM